MTNILIPLGGHSSFFDPTHYPFPKPLIEVDGKPMIQVVIDQFNTLNVEHKFIFVVAKEDCQKFYLDDTLKLLTNYNCEIIQRPGPTMGAACSSLLAIDFIDKNDELIISNGDQFLETDLNLLLDQFLKSGADAAVPTFESVHPKWSYIKCEHGNFGVETAEKRPISKHAIAGFYWFKKGSDFVSAAMKMILKNATTNDQFYISAALNELILEDKSVFAEALTPGKYHSFYSPQKIKEFESTLSKFKKPA